MKTLTHILFLIILLSCGEKTPKEKPALSDTNDSTTFNTSIKYKEKKPKKKTALHETLLCKVNGKDWGYTSASGIVSTQRKTGKRKAVVTFKRKLEKGSESIQLYYDADTKVLDNISCSIKVPKTNKDRGVSVFGGAVLGKEVANKDDINGKIDLSDTKYLSGTGHIRNIPIFALEKKNLANPADSIITITNLKFANISYSDLDKAKALLKSFNKKK